MISSSGRPLPFRPRVRRPMHSSSITTLSYRLQILPFDAPIPARSPMPDLREISSLTSLRALVHLSVSLSDVHDLRLGLLGFRNLQTHFRVAFLLHLDIGHAAPGWGFFGGFFSSVGVSRSLGQLFDTRREIPTLARQSFFSGISHFCPSTPATHGSSSRRPSAPSLIRPLPLLFSARGNFCTFLNQLAARPNFVENKGCCATCTSGPPAPPSPNSLTMSGRRFRHFS